MLRYLRERIEGHAHGRQCFFPSCPYPTCKQAQKDAERYGFNSTGEIARPKPKKLPWEEAA